MYEIVMLANVALWIGMAIMFIRSPAASIYHPFAFYLAFHFLVFVIRPPLVYYREYDFIYRLYEFNPTVQDKSAALLATMLGLFSFGFANLSIAKTPLHFYPRTRADGPRMAMIQPFIIMAAILMPLGVYTLLSSWASGITGETSRVLDLSTGVTINTSSNGYIFESRLMLGPISVLFAWITGFRWYSFLPILIFFLLAGGSGVRGPFVLAGVAITLLWLYDRHRKWPTMKAIVLLVAVAMVFTAIGQDRGRSVRALFVSNQIERGSDASFSDERRFLEGMDTGNLEYIEYLIYAVPQRSNTYGYFVNNLQIFTEPIPRALWSGKPVGEPIRMLNLFDYGFPIGMTRSLPGEGWFNLGYVGVAIWCGLFGMIWGRAYEWFARGKPTDLRLIAYMIFLPLSILFFRDGVLITMLRFGLFLIFPLIVLNFLTKVYSIGAYRKKSVRVRTSLAGTNHQKARRAAAMARYRAQSGRGGHTTTSNVTPPG